MSTQPGVDSPYAWRRLAAAMLLTTVGSAAMYISMVALPAYQGDFGVGRGPASLPFTLVMLGTEDSLVPVETAESRAMSKALKARGFTFVGPTICYAFMQAVGMVNDHLVTCPRHREVASLSGV